METSTLKKLSETLGYSISTISRALKDHPDISASTKKKVKELAAALDYEPNPYAVRLRTQQSRLLGLLIPSINNFFYDSFIDAVEQDARLNGYSLMIMQSGDSETVEQENLKLLRKNMVIGLFAAISIETKSTVLFRKIEDMGTPVIFFDRVPEAENFYKVCLSDEYASRIAAEDIIEKKKQHVLALFGHPDLSICKLRHASFVQTFKTLSPQTKIQVAWPEQIAASKQEVLNAFKQNEKPDTIFCMGDMILVGAMQAIHELNLSVPNDVAVIGISNGLIPTQYNPQITYVETSGYKLGKLAFQQMIGRLNNTPVQREVHLESFLVKGNSL